MCLKKIFLIIASVYIGFGAYLLLTQRSIIYYPDFPVKSNFYDCPAFSDAEKLDMGGTRAYYRHAGESIVVVYPGNAGSACDRSYLRSAIEESDYSFLFVEYAGYAGDERKPSRALLFKDVERTVSFLKTRNYQEILLLSESIGAGLASYHASLLEPDAMLLIAPFDKLSDIAKSHFPFSLYPVSILLKFPGENYENSPLLEGYTGRLVIIHGSEDAIIPIGLGRALFEKVSAPDKKFVAIEGADHNDIYNFRETWEAVSDFLSN